MNRRKQVEQFAKMAAYMLGRRPDEFGLVPDDNGYVATKEFIKAVSELEGWRHIRVSHVTEIPLMLDRPPVETDNERIRAADRSLLPRPLPCPDPPRLLYVCVSLKSYPIVATDGIRPTFYPRVISTPDADLARQWGKRRDNNPVNLVIQTALAIEKGLRFDRLGENIFLSDAIPAGCFTGPPLPKETITEKKEKKVDAIDQYIRQSQAGSFFLTPPAHAPPSKFSRKDKDASWKQNKKRLRRDKKQFWPDDEKG
jgi:putative RNA 2'-phosphotransferase